MNSGIYVIRHAAGRCYVGSAVNILRRWDLHRSQLRRGKHHSLKMQRAWNKYGEGAFTFEVLENVEKELLIEREQHWIDALHACKRGFNTLPAAGSFRGHTWSAQVVEKRRIALTGLKRSPEACARIGAAKRGVPISEEQKAKLSAALKGRPRPLELVQRSAARNRGSKRSPETRARMSAAQKARFARELAQVT
jgi:group I intron endonuclease